MDNMGSGDSKVDEKLLSNVNLLEIDDHRKIKALYESGSINVMNKVNSLMANMINILAYGCSLEYALFFVSKECPGYEKVIAELLEAEGLTMRMLAVCFGRVVPEEGK